MITFNNLTFLHSSANRNIWDGLQTQCPTLTKPEFQRLKTNLISKTKTIVVEHNYVCKDYRNLYANFLSTKFQARSPLCTRIHFFSKTITRENLSNERYANLHYIGFSVIRPIPQGSIGRTIIDPHQLDISPKQNAYLLRTEFTVHLNGTTLKVKGFPYTSQDAEALLCGQTALWNTCRYLSQRHAEYPEWYPYDIISRTGTNHNRAIPYRKMSYHDYCDILTQFGCPPVVITQFTEKKEFKTGTAIQPPPLVTSVPDAYKALYSYLESGFPLLGSHDRHVMNIIGHTIDYDLQPTPDENNLIDASAYTDNLIVIDDNHFPYQFLPNSSPRPELQQPTTSSRYSMKTLESVTCPLPKKVHMEAGRAREQCLSYLKMLRTLSEHLASNQPLVTRLFLTTGTALKRNRLQNSFNTKTLEDSFAAKISEIHFPHFIWIMEIGTEWEYRHQTCSCEIVLDATANPLEDCFIYARHPGKMYLSDTLNEGENNIILAAPTNFSQFTHNLSK